MSDIYTQFKAWNALFDGWYDSIGLACSSQSDFEQFCILELGKNLRPPHISLIDQDKWDEEVKEKFPIPIIDTIYKEVHANREMSDTNFGIRFPWDQEEEGPNPFLSDDFDFEELYEFELPNWYTDEDNDWYGDDEPDFDYLWEIRHRPFLLQTQAFSLPHNPRLRYEEEESFVCS